MSPVTRKGKRGPTVSTKEAIEKVQGKPPAKKVKKTVKQKTVNQQSAKQKTATPTASSTATAVAPAASDPTLSSTSTSDDDSMNTAVLMGSTFGPDKDGLFEGIPTTPNPHATPTANPHSKAAASPPATVQVLQSTAPITLPALAPNDDALDPNNPMAVSGAVLRGGGTEADAAAAMVAASTQEAVAIAAAAAASIQTPSKPAASTAAGAKSGAKPAPATPAASANRNFTQLEDKYATQAYVHTTADQIQGVGHRREHFYQHVHAHYLTIFARNNEQQPHPRTWKQLHDRLKKIKAATKQFVSVHRKVLAKKQSGSNDDSNFQEACKLYKETYGHHFKYKHCYDNLKTLPVYDPTSKVVAAASGTSGSDSDKVITLLSPQGATLERPMGRTKTRQMVETVSSLKSIITQQSKMLDRHSKAYNDSAGKLTAAIIGRSKDERLDRARITHQQTLLERAKFEQECGNIDVAREYFNKAEQNSSKFMKEEEARAANEAEEEDEDEEDEGGEEESSSKSDSEDEDEDDVDN